MLKTVANFLTRFFYLKIKKNVTNKCFKLFKKNYNTEVKCLKKNLHGCKSLTEACFRRKDPNNGKT